MLLLEGKKTLKPTSLYNFIIYIDLLVNFFLAMNPQLITTQRKRRQSDFKSVCHVTFVMYIHCTPKAHSHLRFLLLCFCIFVFFSPSKYIVLVFALLLLFRFLTMFILFFVLEDLCGGIFLGNICEICSKNCKCEGTFGV